MWLFGSRKDRLSNYCLSGQSDQQFLCFLVFSQHAMFLSENHSCMYFFTEACVTPDVLTDIAAAEYCLLSSIYMYLHILGYVPLYLSKKLRIFNYTKYRRGKHLTC